MAVTAASSGRFRHLALFYHGPGEYLAALGGFIQASRARGDAVFVAVPGLKARLVPPGLPPRCNRALPRPPAHAETLDYRHDLRLVRRFVASRATCAGLAPPRITDLVLATSELAGNTLRHAGSAGTVQVWRTSEEIICQVTDTGQITDPLAWHRAPSGELLGGNGLWLVNQVCDLVQARTSQAGTTARLHMRLNRP